MALYIVNTKYTYKDNEGQSCGGEADIFNTDQKKTNIIYEMLSNVRKNIDSVGLIAIYDFHEGNTETYQFFRIFSYEPSYTEDDYIKNSIEYGFGFIEIRIA